MQSCRWLVEVSEDVGPCRESGCCVEVEGVLAGYNGTREYLRGIGRERERRRDEARVEMFSSNPHAQRKIERKKEKSVVSQIKSGCDER